MGDAKMIHTDLNVYDAIEHMGLSQLEGLVVAHENVRLMANDTSPDSYGDTVIPTPSTLRVRECPTLLAKGVAA